MRAIFFDKFNSWYDWGLTLTAKNVSDPEPKTNIIALDGVSGSLDLTEALTGEVEFNDRTLTASFSISEGSVPDRVRLFDQILAALHGRKVVIIEPDDPEHYLFGRVKITGKAHNMAYSTLDISATCDPWRYSVQPTERRVDVNGAVDVVLRNDGVKTVCPVLTVTGTVSITDNGVTTELTDGSYKITDIRLRRGANVVGLSGKGSVIFSYREATF